MQTLTEKLLIYALGRGLTVPGHAGRATDRARTPAGQDYRFSALLEIVKSVPFQMRLKPADQDAAAQSRGAVVARFRTGESADVHHQDVVAAADVPARDGRDAGAAAGSTRWCRRPRRWRKTPARAPTRAGFIYIPHGADMATWTPTGAGAGFELSPTLKPLEPVQGLAGRRQQPEARRRPSTEMHAAAASGWLSGAIPKRTEGEDYSVGTTIDQVVARQIGQASPFPSLEFATEDFTGYIGGCTPGYSCAYMNTISWASPTTPLPMEINPRIAFERLFGDGGSDAERAPAAAGGPQHPRRDRRRGAGAAEPARRRATARGSTTISTTSARSSGGFSRPRSSSTTEVTAVRQAARHSRVVRGAHGADDRSAGDGVPGRSDPRLHVHDVAREQPADLPADRRARSVARGVAPRRPGRKGRAGNAKVNALCVRMLARFVEKLQATPDGDGSLLDHSLIFYGSGMGNSNVHATDPLPLVPSAGAPAQATATSCCRARRRSATCG